jgi:hypothetical protein
VSATALVVLQPPRHIDGALVGFISVRQKANQFFAIQNIAQIPAHQ